MWYEIKEILEASVLATVYMLGIFIMCFVGLISLYGLFYIFKSFIGI